MKITWEEGDITAGVIVCRPGCNERWMIGYHAKADGPNKWTMNSLVDGMVLGPESKHYLAIRLNASRSIPATLLDDQRLGTVL